MSSLKIFDPQKYTQTRRNFFRPLNLGFDLDTRKSPQTGVRNIITLFRFLRHFKKISPKTSAHFEFVGQKFFPIWGSGSTFFSWGLPLSTKFCTKIVEQF